jgi:hypothetical protein
MSVFDQVHMLKGLGNGIYRARGNSSLQENIAPLFDCAPTQDAVDQGIELGPVCHSIRILREPWIFLPLGMAHRLGKHFEQPVVSDRNV